MSKGFTRHIPPGGAKDRIRRTLRLPPELATAVMLAAETAHLTENDYLCAILRGHFGAMKKEKISAEQA